MSVVLRCIELLKKRSRSEGFPRTRITKKVPVRVIVERDLFLSARYYFFFILSLLLSP